MNETNNKLITLDEMRDAIKRAVAERGKSYVYPGASSDSEKGVECRYRFEDGTPGCIVGLAVSYVDPKLTLPERKNAEYALEGVAEFTAITYALKAQDAQDIGRTWGDALSVAESFYDRLKG